MAVQDILEQITEEKIIEIMEDLGSPIYKRTIDRRTNQTCLWFRTICHGGDSHKLCFFLNSKDFYCYTSCGRMTFFNCINKIREDKTFKDSYRYILSKLGKSSKERKGIILNSEEMKENRQEFFELDKALNYSEYKRLNNTQYYDKTILNYFDHNTFYQGWIDEGISIEVMKQFGIAWYEYGNHIIIPHFDIEGNLIGIRRRSLNPEDAKNKYMPETIEEITYEHPLGLNLYGLYENKKAIERQKKAIIVEAEKSVLLSNTYFGKNSVAVATCGFNISDWQIDALLKLGVEKIWLGFDKDYDLQLENEYKEDATTYRKFLNYKNRLLGLCEKVAPYAQVYLIRDRKNYLKIKDSPLDRGKDTFMKLMKDSKLIITQS